MNYLETNLKILHKKDSETSKLIEKTRNSIFKLEQSKIENEFTIQVNGKYLYSKYNPVKYTERQIPVLSPNTKIVIILGLGLGYHLETLLKIRKDIKIVIVEKNAAMFKLFLSIKDRTEILQNKNIIFFINKKVNFIEFTLNSKLTYLELAELKIIEVYKNIRYEEEYYLNAKKAVSMILSEKIKNFWTKYFLEETWTNNITENIKYIFDSVPVNRFNNKFKNIPAVIVCAGPSLDKNVHLLSSIKNKAVIISVDTALRSVLKNGTIPDFVISLDAQKENFSDFQNIKTDNLLLIYDLVTYPEIVSSFKGSKIVSITGHHVYDEAKKQTVEFTPFWKTLRSAFEDTGYLQTGGSVSTSAFDAARQFGCNPIIFIGQDLAFTGGKTHSNDSYDIKNDRQNINKFNTSESLNYFRISSATDNNDNILVKSADGRLIRTNSSMRHYLNWLEDAFKLVPVKCINCTEGGALIKGADIMKFSAAIDRYMKKKHNISSEINKILKSKIFFNRNKFNVIINNQISIMEEIRKIGENYIDNTDIEKKKYIYTQESINFRKKIDEMDVPLLLTYKREFVVRKMALEKIYTDKEELKKVENNVWYQIMLNASAINIKVLKKLKNIIECRTK